MASLSDTAVVQKLLPGFVAIVLGLIASDIAKPFWQLTGHRHYWWFVGPAIVAAYLLVFAFHLKGRCAGLPFTQSVLIQIIAILAVWCWVDLVFRIVNCGLDRSAATEVTAQVVGADRRKGSYLLELSGPPAFNRAEVMVGDQAYGRSRLRGLVVITWHKGALGEGWCGRRPVRGESPPLAR